MSGVLARLRAAGLTPRRRLGQHFLHDPRLLGAIVDEAGIGASDVVLEVGTGAGTLTRELARRARRVISIDVDAELLAFARGELTGFDNVEFEHLDVLAGKHRLAPRLEELLAGVGSFVWVSNLPYNIATPLVLLMSESSLPWTSGHLLVQEEVARRLAADAGDPAYGASSALLAFWWRSRRRGRRVPAGAFWPPPKVESRVLHLEDRRPLGSRAEFAAYAAWVRLLFAGRRKQLRARLREVLDDATARRVLARGGWSPRTRGDRLTAADFLLLAREFRRGSNPGNTRF